ncbi:hypothetical protein [Nitrospira sp. Nam74]
MQFITWLYLRHLVDAIARGQGTDSIYQTLRAEEERKKSLLRQLQDLSALEQTVSLDEKRLLSVLQERISDFLGLLGSNIPAARQILRKMIEGRFCASRSLNTVRPLIASQQPGRMDPCYARRQVPTIVVEGRGIEPPSLAGSG